MSPDRLGEGGENQATSNPCDPFGAAGWLTFADPEAF
jgi:hypothetical protein